MMQSEPQGSSVWKALGITVAVVALVGCTLITLIGIGLVMSMRSFGSNK